MEITKETIFKNLIEALEYNDYYVNDKDKETLNKIIENHFDELSQWTFQDYLQFTEGDEEFWVLVYKEKNSKEEITERYDDFDDVRSDFKYLSEQNSEDYEYVVLQKVTESQIDGETIEEISRYENNAK